MADNEPGYEVANRILHSPYPRHPQQDARIATHVKYSFLPQCSILCAMRKIGIDCERPGLGMSLLFYFLFLFVFWKRIFLASLDYPFAF